MPKKTLIALLVVLALAVGYYLYVKRKQDQVDAYVPDSGGAPAGGGTSSGGGTGGAPAPKPAAPKPANPTERKRLADDLMKKWRADASLQWTLTQTLTVPLCDITAQNTTMAVPGASKSLTTGSVLPTTGRTGWHPEFVNLEGFIFFSQPNSGGHKYYIVLSPYSLTLVKS